MSEVLFQSGDITVTRSVAKFGNSTYPIANIGSVVIEREPGFLAVMAVLSGFILGAFLWAASNVLVGVAAFFALLFLSRFLPQKRKITLKTSSGDVTALKSGDVALVESVHRAIETAFTR